MNSNVKNVLAATVGSILAVVAVAGAAVAGGSEIKGVGKYTLGMTFDEFKSLAAIPLDARARSRSCG